MHIYMHIHIYVYADMSMLARVRMCECMCVHTCDFDSTSKRHPQLYIHTKKPHSAFSYDRYVPVHILQKVYRTRTFWPKEG